MAIALDSTAYARCRDHRQYSDKAQARRARQWHVAGFRAGRFRCGKCVDGFRFHVWRCDAIGAPVELERWRGRVPRRAAEGEAS